MDKVKERLSYARKNVKSCSTKDVWRFEKQIRQVETFLSKKGGKGRKLPVVLTSDPEGFTDSIATGIDKSISGVAHRRTAIPPMTFPDQLPVAEKAEEITKLLAAHQVVIVAGETGSGKTTQLPKICMAMGLGARGLIGHTQPRRLAARSVAGRIAQECGSELGDLIGYQVRFHEQVSSASYVKLMTDGILLAEIQSDPYLRKYEVIIVDEAHERSLNIDFLLGYLKTLLPKRPDLKLVITSATIDVERFSEFFNQAPIISVSGRTYPVEVRYRPLTLLVADEEDVSIQEAIGQVITEIEQEERANKQLPGDVLIFMSGERDIRETAKYLRDSNVKNANVMPLYARLSAAEQSKIFQPGRGRKIVLATNVAETSITVPGIRYVIDPGKARISRYSFRSKVQRLPIESISQASANQRKGRCGRVESGICFRLYSEEDFVSRPEFTDPEIVRTNLASVILQMAQLNLGDIKHFPFLERPDNRLINDGYTLLFELGAVSEKQKLTETGRLLARIPADPRLGRILIEAHKNQCLAEALVICSALAIQDPREKPHDKQQAATQAHKQFEDKDSDFLSFYNLWNALEAERQALTNSQFRKYCQKNFISFLRYREWRDLHRQIHLILKELKLTENETSAGYDPLHKSLLCGLLGHIGIKDEKNNFKGARNKQFFLFPGSALFKKQPKWVMCAELVETTKVYARVVAKIEPEWVEAAAAHLTKSHYFEPHWEKKRGQVVGFVNISLYGLPIVHKRRVNYAHVDQPLSREIFIRSALVEEDIHTKAPFYRANLKLIEKITSQEEKTRRRDILVEDEVIFQLYDNVIPDDVVSVRHFDSWWKGLDKKALESLYFTEAQLTNEASELAALSAYPDFYQTDSVRFKLDYQFKPGEKSDGVTLITPVAALKQLSEKRLEWVVPGFLKEKCTQLIKSLPKQYRRNFVPVPDYVEKVVPKLSPSSDSLISQLAKELRYLTGVTVPLEAWQEASVDPHLQINVRVVDAQGRALFESRNLDEIIERYGQEQVQVRAMESMEGTWGQEGITEWNFGELPREIKKKQAGVVIRMFPYVRDDRKSVSLLASTDELFAKNHHLLGLSRLVALSWKESLAFTESKLSHFNKSALLFAPTGKKIDLLDDFFIALIRQHVFGGALPHTQAHYESIVESKRADFFDAAIEFDRTLFDIITPYHECMKRTKGKLNLQLASSIADVKNQLVSLVYPGFLSHTPWEWLTEFPRYFQATLVRLDKMAREMKKEREFLLFMGQCLGQYQQLAAQYQKHGIESEALSLYRWMLEEYRVSCFAQQLGTRMTISEKRLEKQWQAVQDERM